MSSTSWTNPRNMIPRWTTLAWTKIFGELETTKKSSNNYSSSSLPQKIEAWNYKKDIVSASELLETTLIEAPENTPNESFDAANWLISEDVNAAISLRDLAKHFINPPNQTELYIQAKQFSPKTLKPLWRNRVKKYAHNPLAWVELSLLDIVDNKPDPAMRSMQIALQLAPENRHVVRSASRFFLHRNDPKRAYDVIVNCPTISTDPWIIAAELSYSMLLQRPPKYLKKAIEIVYDNNYSYYHKSELSGALGLFELQNGQKNKALEYFNISTKKPTGNSLAEIEWITLNKKTENLNSLEIPSNPSFTEASVFQLLHEKKFEFVSSYCERWSNVEPHSIRPYEIGSTIECKLSNFDRAISLAKEGLDLGNESVILLNNLAYAYIHLKRYDDAKSQLKKIKEDKVKNIHNWYLSQANRGLLAIRENRIEEGINLYNNAISGFEKESSSKFAKLLLAKELLKVNYPNVMNYVGEAIGSANTQEDRFQVEILDKINEILIQKKNLNLQSVVNIS